MSKKHLWIVGLIFCCFPVLRATTFIPLSIENKIEDSDAVVLGSYQGSIYKKDKSGIIITEATISIEKSLGVKFNQIVTNNGIKVRFPGGIWGGRTYKVEGVPKFKEGERVVLFLKDSEGSFWVHNLASGKYSLKRKGGDLYLESEIFRDKEGIGSIDYDKFEKLLEESHFSSKLTEAYKETDIIIANGNGKFQKLKKDRMKRTPANAKSFKNNPHEDETSAPFNKELLVILFVLFGLGFTFYVRRQ